MLSIDHSSVNRPLLPLLTGGWTYVIEKMSLTKEQSVEPVKRIEKIQYADNNQQVVWLTKENILVDHEWY